MVLKFGHVAYFPFRTSEQSLNHHSKPWPVVLRLAAQHSTTDHLGHIFLKTSNLTWRVILLNGLLVGWNSVLQMKLSAPPRAAKVQPLCE